MIYFGADLHLVRYVWKGHKELDGDSYRALEAMVDVVIKDKTDEQKMLLLAGDIFEQDRIDGRTLDAFEQALDRLADADISVVFIQGQHDFNEPPHAQVMGAMYVNEQFYSFDERVIYGLDWRPREQLQEDIKNVPECDILVLHAMFEHMIDFAAAADISLDDIPKRVANVFVGDVHVQDLVPFRGKNWCLSPGPLHSCNVTQGAPKAVWKLGKKSQKPEPLWLPGRQIWRLKALEGDIEELFVAEVDTEAALYPPIVELSYDREQQEEVDRLMLKYGNNAVFFPKPYSGGKLLELDTEEEESQSELVSMPEVIAQVIPRPDAPELHDLMQDLWKENAVDVVQRKIATVLEEPTDETVDPDFD